MGYLLSSSDRISITALQHDVKLFSHLRTTEVKPPDVDGTALVTVWESKTPPGVENQ